MKYRSEVSLQRYGILMPYLEYENSSFWNRNNFFIITNTALLGFLIQVLTDSCSPPSSNKILFLFGYCIAGLFLSCLWLLGIIRSAKWIKHWHNQLDKIEKGAFGENFNVFGDPSKRKGAKNIAYWVWFLFFVLWICLLIWLKLNYG